MDPSSPPPWRIFDDPGDAPADKAAPGGGPLDSARAGPGSLPADSGVAPAMSALVAGPVPIVAGLVVAVAGIVLAVVLAQGGIGGAVTLDPVGAHPIGSSGASAGAGVVSGTIVVDVAGAVLRPGVFHLAAGSRIGDAIAAAGGYSPRVAAALVGRSLNLAAVVHDGDQIVVPSRDDPGAGPSAGAGGGAGGGGAGGSGGTGGGGGGPVDLNRATAEALDALPGIGPVTAAKIIASRQDSPFASVDELLSRKLVGQKVFDQIKALVTVG